MAIGGYEYNARCGDGKAPWGEGPWGKVSGHGGLSTVRVLWHNRTNANTGGINGGDDDDDGSCAHWIVGSLELTRMACYPPCIEQVSWLRVLEQGTLVLVPYYTVPVAPQLTTLTLQIR